MIPTLPALLLLAGLARAAPPPSVPELPPGQTFAFIDELTPEMRWFRLDFMAIEQTSCEVGVPVGGQGELRTRCWFPGVDGEEDDAIPAEIRLEARLARREVRDRFRNKERRARDMNLHYLGTWRKVILRDLVLLEPGPPESAVLRTGQAAFRLETRQGPGGVEPALTLSRGGPLGETQGGTGLYCSGTPCPTEGLLDWAPPAALDGQSILYGMLFEEDPRAAQAWPALEADALRAIVAKDQGRFQAAELRRRPLAGLERVTRLPISARRRGDELTWTAFEDVALNPRDGLVHGLGLQVCPVEGSEPHCITLLQGGSSLDPQMKAQLPPGQLRVRVELFETDRPPGHLWNPHDGNYASLWRREFIVEP